MLLTPHKSVTVSKLWPELPDEDILGELLLGHGLAEREDCLRFGSGMSLLDKTEFPFPRNAAGKFIAPPFILAAGRACFVGYADCMAEAQSQLTMLKAYVAHEKARATFKHCREVWLGVFAPFEENNWPAGTTQADMFFINVKEDDNNLVYQRA